MAETAMCIESLQQRSHDADGDVTGLAVSATGTG